MPSDRISALRSAFSRLQWARGLRAGVVILTIAAVCTHFHKPLGWACVGGFLSIVVDNGGPYRSRLANIATFLCGGTLACCAGSFAATNIVTSVLITAAFCFAATYARVLTQPLASSSVAILVCYFASYGGGRVTLTDLAARLALFLSGGLFSASLALFLWPADPFRPARRAVADAYDTLTLLTRNLCSPDLAAQSTTDARRRDHELRSQLRLHIEAAQDALSATPARVPSRTVRARNLTVLLQALDLLFARILRVSELTVDANHPAAAEHRAAFARWLATSLAAIGPALRERPHDTAASFAPEGSHSVELHRRVLRFEHELDPTALTATPSLSAEYDAQLAALERDCLFNLEVAFEAVRAIWSGAEPRVTRAARLRASLASTTPRPPSLLLDSLRANFTLRSVMMRHAIRLTGVAVADVLLLRHIHISHGYWLAMTSIIVLQPYTGNTFRRFAERVGGTVAGGILAAVLASALPNEQALIAVVIVCACLSAAVYAVDYALYCFFLTPTFVLLALPHLRDWHFAFIRMGTTLIGACTAVVAMLVWRDRESLRLPGRLARSATAAAAYLHAMLAFWHACTESSTSARTAAERTLLAPARRACGLANNDAEESLDRAILEPNLSLRSRNPETAHLTQDALTFTTYVRRLTQSITTLAALCEDSPQHQVAVAAIAVRLETLAAALEHHTPIEITDTAPATPVPAISLAAKQLRRMERQVAILERATADINAAP